MKMVINGVLYGIPQNDRNDGFLLGGSGRWRADYKGQEIATGHCPKSVPESQVASLINGQLKKIAQGYKPNFEHRLMGGGQFYPFSVSSEILESLWEARIKEMRIKGELIDIAAKCRELVDEIRAFVPDMPLPQLAPLVDSREELVAIRAQASMQADLKIFYPLWLENGFVPVPNDNAIIVAKDGVEVILRSNLLYWGVARFYGNGWEEFRLKSEGDVMEAIKKIHALIAPSESSISPSPSPISVSRIVPDPQGNSVALRIARG